MTETILYARVSTADQNIEHQKAQAEAAGFAIDRVIEDAGVSRREHGLRPSAGRVRACSTSCGPVMCWWSAGSTGWAGTTRT